MESQITCGRWKNKHLNNYTLYFISKIWNFIVIYKVLSSLVNIKDVNLVIQITLLFCWFAILYFGLSEFSSDFTVMEINVLGLYNQIRGLYLMLSWLMFADLISSADCSSEAGIHSRLDQHYNYIIWGSKLVKIENTTIWA